MSFILDALRKSETERQQQSNAEFANVPVGARSKSGRRWLWVVVALLAINLAVLAGLLLRTPADAIPIVVSDETAASEPTSSGETMIEPSFLDQVAAARRKAPQKQTESPLETAGDHTVKTASIEAIVISENPESIPAGEVYPTIHAMRAGGAISISDLHLDIHVYSEAPDDRFVFINMTKHREGSQLDEGPVVDKITPDGVVLEHQGLFFLLPRE